LVAPGAAYDAKLPISELLVLKESPIRSARDLSGKIVGIQSLSDLDTIATRAWVDDHGGDSKTVQFVEMPMATKAAALDSHRVDAAIVGQPFLAEAVASGKVRVLATALDSIAPRFTQSAWFATNQWVLAHPDVVRKFQQVVERADAYVNNHHAEVAPYLAEFLHLQSVELHGLLGTTLTPRDIQPVVDVALRYRAITQPLDAKALLAR
jgi:NitT/TauT family transport system substrate-binding protein